MDFTAIANAAMQLANATGRNAKMRLLKHYETLEGFKDVMKFIYDPAVATGIADAKLNKKAVVYQHLQAPVVIGPYEMMSYLKTNNTGSDADVSYCWQFMNQQPTDETLWLARALVTQNLRIGVNASTLNAVYGKGFIMKIDMMRGTLYGDVTKTTWPMIATEKLDGQRRLLVKDNGRITIYTRNGLIDEGYVDIVTEAMFLPDNYMYDGELLAIGNFADSIEQRQVTSSLASKAGIKKDLTYNIFDAVPIAAVREGYYQASTRHRKLMLAAWFGDVQTIAQFRNDAEAVVKQYNLPFTFDLIKPVPVLKIVTSEEEMLELAEKLWAGGREGLMLNNPTANYQFKQTKDMLKVKRVKEYDLRVIDIYEGTNDFVGMMGGVIVEYKGYRVGCGSGFSVDQRKQFWANKRDIVGKLVEVESFGESKNKTGGLSLNCPIFKRIKGGA
jgi:DNA ligase-1